MAAGKIRRDVLYRYTHEPARYLAGFDDLFHHILSHVAGDGEADAEVSSARAGVLRY